MMHKYILLGLGVAFALTACNDQLYLEEDPKTIYTMENAFDKPSQVDAALAQAYSRFNNLNGYGNRFIGGAPGNFLHGDGSDVLDGTQGRASASGAFSNYWALQSDNGNFLSLWNELYQLAASANLALYGADQQESDSRTYLVAQGRFFRGWAYLRLAECFGGVPIVKEFDSSLKFDYTRATREETYSFAIEDLKAAAAGLPDEPQADGRLCKGMANHMLAEALLGIGVETGDAKYFDQAITAADAVIARHPLMTVRFGSRSASGSQPSGVPTNGIERYRADGNVFYDLFQIGNFDRSAGNTEALYVRQTPSYEEQANYGGSVMPLGITIGPPYRDIIWKVGSGREGGPWQLIDQKEYMGAGGTYYLGGLTWGMIGTTNYVDEDIWEGPLADDIRNSQIVLCDPIVLDVRSDLKGQTINPDEMLEDPSRYSRISAKMAMQDLWGWDLAHSTAFGSSTFVYQFCRDWYVARSSETYLLRAEAKLRKGDKAGAAQDINTVRQRAQASYLYSEGEVDIYTILDERARELVWEECRWPTLLRMGGNGSNEVLKHQLENYSIHTNDDGTFAGKAFPSWTLFPIPYSVRNLNKEAELTQNPGWN